MIKSNWDLYLSTTKVRRVIFIVKVIYGLCVIAASEPQSIERSNRVLESFYIDTRKESFIYNNNFWLILYDWDIQ